MLIVLSEDLALPNVTGNSAFYLCLFSSSAVGYLFWVIAVGRVDEDFRSGLEVVALSIRG